MRAFEFWDTAGKSTLLEAVAEVMTVLEQHTIEGVESEVRKRVQPQRPTKPAWTEARVAGFTKPAEDLARLDQRRIRLFDLEKVFDLWVEHYARVSEKHRRLLRLRLVWFLAPSRS